MQPRDIDAELVEDDFRYDVTLRPTSLTEFVGQDRIRDNLRVFVQAARDRGEPLDHVLLHGPPGLGKTTMAYIIAHEMGVKIQTTSGPALEKPGELAAILSNIANREVLFIDEIHRLNRVIEEKLYSAMEDYVLDLVIGKGPAAHTFQLQIKPFTLVGATTRASLLTVPNRG